MPYKIKNTEEKWEISDLYNEFMELFPQEQYKIIHNGKYNIAIL